MPEYGCSVARDAFFSCMDLRTQRVRRELIDYLGIKDGTFDLISVPGGAGDFRQLERCLRLSCQLHSVEEAILTVHEDCGAGAKKGDLLRAARIATKMGVKYRAFYLFRTENGWTWEEIVFSEEELLSPWRRLLRKCSLLISSRSPAFEQE